MNKATPMAQIYGYIVCLTAVITFLICVADMINAISDRGDPMHSQRRSDQAASLASFETYKMDMLRSLPKDGETSKAAYVPDDQALREMYESAKTEKVQTVMHDTRTSIAVDGILIFISIVLFATHWRWIRKLSKAEA